MLRRRCVSLIVLVGVLLGSLGFPAYRSFARDKVDFPDPVGFVNDFANVLDNDDELEEKLRNFAGEESTEIFVITTDTLPDDLTVYGFVPKLTDTNERWKAGQDEYDNGIIFTVVLDSREMAIDVGYGLEGAIPDITATRILDNEVKPYFLDEDYSGGVEAGVDAIMKAVKGEYEGVGAAGVDGEDGDSVFVTLCMCGLFFVFPYLAAFLGRTKSWWLGGVIGLIAALIIAGWIAFSGVFGTVGYLSFLVLTPLLTGLGLLFDFILSKTYKVRKSRGLSTGWARSFGGFSSGSSSSFGGGFGGGSGGSFGGGGGRSSW